MRAFSDAIDWMDARAIASAFLDPLQANHVAAASGGEAQETEPPQFENAFSQLATLLAERRVMRYAKKRWEEERAHAMEKGNKQSQAHHETKMEQAKLRAGEQGKTGAQVAQVAHAMKQSNGGSSLDQVSVQILQLLQNALRCPPCRRWLARSNTHLQLAAQVFCFLQDELQGRGAGGLTLGVACQCVRALIMPAPPVLLESDEGGETQTTNPKQAKQDDAVCKVLCARLLGAADDGKHVLDVAGEGGNHVDLAVDGVVGAGMLLRTERVRALVFIAAVRRVVKVEMQEGRRTVWVQIEAQRAVARACALLCSETSVQGGDARLDNPIPSTHDGHVNSTHQLQETEHARALFVSVGAIKVLCDLAMAKSVILQVEGLEALCVLIGQVDGRGHDCDIRLAELRLSVSSQTNDGELLVAVIGKALETQAREHAVQLAFSWWTLRLPGQPKDPQHCLLATCLQSKLNLSVPLESRLIGLMKQGGFDPTAGRSE